LRGKEYFKDGELNFPEGEEIIDGTYRTLYGYGASHNGSIYRNSNHNMKYAMRRLTGKRLVFDDLGVQIPNYHEKLFRNQSNFFRESKAFFREVGGMYEDYFRDYKGSEEEAREHYNDPHAKRLLRVQAWEELTNENRVVDHKDPWVSSVLWKLKKNEWAKPKKKPRMIGDLGVGASLRGFRVTDALKRAQNSETVFVNGGEMYFCKTPDPTVLKSVFDKLMNPEGKFYFVYFSDDSCLSVRRSDGGVDFYNLDISSCDASHGPEIFKTLVDLVPASAKEDMQMLVDQCTLPLRVVSRVDPSHKLLMRPNRPMLYSGSTITTAINNIANLAIGLAISQDVVAGRYTGAETIRLAAERSGYIVTGCLPLESPEDLQFLKHSPVLDERNNYQPMLNLGVLFRASGVCKGDLPGKGSWQNRAAEHQAGLLRSAYPQASFEILDLMKRTVGDHTSVFKPEMYGLEHKVVVNNKFVPFHAKRESIMRRYRLTDEEYQEVLEFASCGYETFLNAPALTKILKLDYGLECIAEEIVDYGNRY